MYVGPAPGWWMSFVSSLFKFLFVFFSFFLYWPSVAREEIMDTMLGWRVFLTTWLDFTTWVVSCSRYEWLVAVSHVVVVGIEKWLVVPDLGVDSGANYRLLNFGYLQCFCTCPVILQFEQIGRSSGVRRWFGSDLDRTGTLRCCRCCCCRSCCSCIWRMKSLPTCITWLICSRISPSCCCILLSACVSISMQSDASCVRSSVSADSLILSVSWCSCSRLLPLAGCMLVWCGFRIEVNDWLTAMKFDWRWTEQGKSGNREGFDVSVVELLFSLFGSRTSYSLTLGVSVGSSRCLLGYSGEVFRVAESLLLLKLFADRQVLLFLLIAVCMTNFIVRTVVVRCIFAEIAGFCRLNTNTKNVTRKVFVLFRSVAVVRFALDCWSNALRS